MDYRYTELDYAKNIYENGFQSQQHRPTELRLVATYMRRFLGYKPQKLREEMYKWCETHIAGYKRELCYKMIHTAINQACRKGSTLVNLDHIDFYQYELDYLNGLSIRAAPEFQEESEFSYACRKLLFTLLFQMKVNKQMTEAKSLEEDFEYKGRYFKGGQRKYTKLKKLAKLPDQVRINEDLINTLWRNGLVTPMFNGLVRLDFMDKLESIQRNLPAHNSAVALRVKDYESVGWYFDYYNKEKRVAFCRNCGKLFWKKSNRQECCSEECSKTVDREKARKRMQLARKDSCSI